LPARATARRVTEQHLRSSGGLFAVLASSGVKD